MPIEIKEDYFHNSVTLENTHIGLALTLDKAHIGTLIKALDFVSSVSNSEASFFTAGITVRRFVDMVVIQGDDEGCTKLIMRTDEVEEVINQLLKTVVCRQKILRDNVGTQK